MDLLGKPDIVIDVDLIEALLPQNGLPYYPAGSEIPVAFLTALPTYDAETAKWIADPAQFVALTEVAQQDAIKNILARFSEVSGVRFKFLAANDPIPQGAIRIGAAAVINPETKERLGGINFPQPVAGGLPSLNDVLIDIAQLPGLLSPGSGGYRVVLHELLHAVGFPGHLSEQRGFTQDVSQSSAVSMSSYAIYEPHLSVYAQSPQVLDIAALQALYGPGAGGASSTRYVFDPTSRPGTFGETIYRGNIRTIWDSEGDDTLDASGYVDPTSRLEISLDYRYLSSIGGEKNIAVARGSRIENVVGSAGRDKIIGNELNNVLYGAAGDDTIIGGDGDDIIRDGAGSDLLAGGAGNDKYEFATGAIDEFTFSRLDEVVEDDDGVGSLWVDSIQLTGGTKSAPNTWTGGGWTYVLASGGDLSITKVGTGERITVRDWATKTSTLGISLQDGPASPPPTVGDGNPINGGSEADSLFGSGAADIIRSFDGDDTINAQQGAADYIDVGWGNDAVGAGSQNDTLVGGPGRDILFGNAGDDEIWGNERTDLNFVNSQTEALGGGESNILNGWVGNDSIYGGAAADSVFAGTEADLVVGGAGDDNLYGDVILHNAAFTWEIGREILALPSGTIRYEQVFSGVTTENPTVGGNDTLYGGAGSDWINGGLGADIVEGGTGDDVLWGGGGDDIVDGEDGADVISGDGSTSGQGNELGYVALAAHGNDLLYAGLGDDKVFGDGGNDYIDGDEGSDTLVGGAGNDEVFGGDGSDLLRGGDDTSDDSLDGADYLDGEAGNDSLWGDGGADTLFGGSGSDVLYGDNVLSSVDAPFHGADYLDGEDDNDTLIGLGGADTLYGGDGADELYGGGSTQLAADGNDYLDGEAGNDTAYGGGGSDQLFGGDGDDTLVGDDGDLPAANHGGDYLDGENGNDSLVGCGGDDTLFGGEGNDSVFGDNAELSVAQHGADYLDGEAGNDNLSGMGGNDTVVGGVGNDSLFGNDGADLLAGGDDADSLIGGAGADTLYGESGNDLAWGDAGNDLIDGGDGEDQLQGGSDADTLLGALGLDTLFGGAGDDSLEGGDGEDWLQGDSGNDYLVGGSGVDTLLGGEGEDTLVADGGDILVGGDGDDTYRINFAGRHSSATEYVQDHTGGNRLQFAGVTVDDLQLTPNLRINGFMELTSASTENSIGIDSLLQNFSTVQVGSSVFSSSRFFGLTYMWDVSESRSEAGASLSGGRQADTLSGSGGGSTFSGGLGNDILTGSGGGNTYLYNRGDGTDTISDPSAVGQRGTVVFGAGIQEQDLRLSVEGGAMVVTMGGQSTDQLRITGFDPSNAASTPSIQSYAFADGSTLTHEALVARGVDVQGTERSEVVSGTDIADHLSSHAGNDTISGGKGADTYLFNVGDGADVVADGDVQAGAGDVLRFGDGIAPSDLRAWRDGNDVTLIAGDDQVTLRDFFSGGADAIERIEFADGTVWGANEVSARVTEGESQDWVLIGTSGNNTLHGLGGNDSLDGLGGSDLLTGASGNDTLIGGAGYDVLLGQAGSDTYIVMPGSEQDHIDERDGGEAGGIDVLRFDGVRFADTYISVNGNDLSIVSRGYGPYFNANVRGQLDADSPINQVELFQFSDQVLTAGQMKQFLLRSSDASDWVTGFGGNDEISGGRGNDHLFGVGGNDSLRGGEGHDELSGGAGSDQLYGDVGSDTLSGGDGDDTLSGGAGRDRLDGGLGNDQYSFARGAGMDILTADAGGVDTIRVMGVTSANVTFNRVSSPPAPDLTFKGDSLVIQIDGGADQLWLANYFDPAAPGFVEKIVLDDGTSWTYSGVLSNLKTLGGVANTVSGTTKADTFTIDHWNDVVNDPSLSDADAANASVSWQSVTSVTKVVLTGGFNLFALGSTMSDSLQGNAGANTLYFTKTISDGIDSLAGGAGDDLYIVGAEGEAAEVYQNADTGMGGVTISEAVGSGTDTVRTGFWSAKLPDNVEILEAGTPNPYPFGGFNFSYDSLNDYTHRFIGNALNNIIDTTTYEDAAGYQGWAGKASRPSYIGVLDFRLDGGLGADTLVGGAWHDTYVIDNAGDVVVETGLNRDGIDTSNDTVETPYETSLLTQFANVENVTLTGSVAVGATGNDRANKLDGSLNSAVNRLVGGLGNDTYVVGAGDVVVEDASGGIDTLLVSGTFVGVAYLANFPNVENIRLLANAGNLSAHGTALGQQVTGSLGNNQLWGEDGDDTIADQYLGDIQFVGRDGGDHVVPTADQDALYGGEGNDILASRGGVDTLIGGAGTDTFQVWGGDRSVVLGFGLGDGQDSLEQEPGAVNVAIEFGGSLGAADVVLAQAGGMLTFTLADGSRLAVKDANAITLRFPDGMVLGPTQVQAMLRSSDRSTATEQGDLLFGAAGNDQILSLGGDDAVYAGAGADTLDGGTGNDVLLGDAEADVLIGGTGSDTLGGGTGADTYQFSRGFGRDVADDLYTGGSVAGVDDGAVDVVQFDATIVTSDVAVYRKAGVSGPTGLVLAIAGSGDRLTIEREYATSGAIELVRFANGTQWDLATLKSKIVGEVGDDTNNTLTAPVSGSVLEGGGGDDTLTGSAGADTLDGGIGFDSMTGGAGNDTYYVDSAADQVFESSRGGTDTVISSVDGYFLRPEFEKLQLAAGTQPLSGLGNSVVNTLMGNAGDNRLDGLGGADTMSGGAGNDTYVVDSTGDVVTELTNEGSDWVESTITYTLGANVENLRLMGTGKINGTGNALDNLLVGNSGINSLSGGAGNDTLDGGAGADSMTGGAGNDTYVVDNAIDKAIEAASGGIDTIQTTLTFTLPTEVEILILTGTGTINGTGNTLANRLDGNDAANTLNGATGADLLIARAGNDTLLDQSGNNAFDGGSGSDTVTGGTLADFLTGGRDADTFTWGGGADVFAFNRWDGVDTISAPTAGAGLGEHNDAISFGQITLASIRFARETNDLLLKISGTGDAVRLKDWYAAAGNQTVSSLQVNVDSSSDYVPGSADTLRAERSVTFNFDKLVAAFDAAKASNPGLLEWAPGDTVLQSATTASSSSAMFGGSLAYRYAHSGTVASADYQKTVQDLSATGFGSSMQAVDVSLIGLPITQGF